MVLFVSTCTARTKRRFGPHGLLVFLMPVEIVDSKYTMSTPYIVVLFILYSQRNFIDIAQNRIRYLPQKALQAVSY